MESSSASNDDGIPRELKEKLASFDTHLSELEEGLNPLISIPRAELAEQVGQDHIKFESDYTGANFYYQMPFISSGELCSRI